MAQQVFIPSEPSMAHFTEEFVILLIVLLPGVSAETVLPHEPLTTEIAKELLLLIFALQFAVTQQEFVAWELTRTLHTAKQFFRLMGALSVFHY